MTLSIFYDFWQFHPLKMTKYTTSIYGFCNLALFRQKQNRAVLYSVLGGIWQEFGIVGHNPSVSKSKTATCCDLSVFSLVIEVYP